MMTTQLAQGDYGRPLPIQHVLADGQAFTPTELSIATIVNRIWHADHLKVEMVASNANVEIDIRPDRINLYTALDTIVIDSELMTVVSVDVPGNFITVTRLNPYTHRRGSLIRHTISELNTSVAWSGPAGSLMWTPDILETTKIGSFRYELEITSGAKVATATMSSLWCPYVLNILAHGAV
jgi:hypothetical protein